METEHLGLDVWREVRRNLDGVVAPRRVAVLYVCITFAAHAGAGVLHIGTWVNTQQQLCCQLQLVLFQLSPTAGSLGRPQHLQNKHVMSPRVSWCYPGPHHVS